MELWDILDAEGNKTGRTIERGQLLKQGEYHLVVHVFILNGKGEFLIQKRSMNKEIWPGLWDITGGAVVSGEDSLTGALREVEEELGITLAPENFSLITRLQRKNRFADLWAAYADIAIEDVIMQAGEVDDVKYVNAGEMINLILNAEHPDDEYKQIIVEFIKSNDDQ
ncbi:MAG: NUDIX domain-containing protein [Clostridia bacterium]|nr:NUDIX domain-containing protein [Clostridia bacterium]